MSVALAPSPLTLLDTQPERDAHGWAVPGVDLVVWQGQGNLQEDRPQVVTQTMEQGGAGPHDPVTLLTARAYVPLDVAAAPGMAVVSADDPDFRWLVTTVRISRDPLGPGGLLPCQVLTLSRVMRP